MTSPAAQEEAQHGLFGPGSVTWRVHSDPLMGLAALRALLMRVLHPAAQASVFATQDWLDEPWERVASTLRYLGVITFGTSSEAIMAAARVRAIHAQVHGSLADGRGYRGDDPDLITWMHCCQVSSFLEVTRRGGLVLSPAERDQYICEQVRTAVAWGLEPDEVPVDQRTLATYLRRARADLGMTGSARIFIDSVVEPGMPEMMMFAQRGRPAWASVAGLAFASLPGWAQRFYGPPPALGPAGLSTAATTVALHTVREGLLGRPVALGNAGGDFG